MASYVEIDYNGVIYEFPDTMSDDEMLGIIRDNTRVQSPGIDVTFPLSFEEQVAPEATPPEAPKVDYGEGIDFGFIRQLEGFETKGYVPRRDGKVLGTSGVTIGAGIDLGQWTPEALADMGVDEATVDRLRPYIGLKNDKAYSFLRKHPLSMPREQVEQLNDRVKRHFADRVAKAYRKDSQIDWTSMQPEFKTVITSVLFQYGYERAGERLPKFWGAVTKGDWQAAYKELRNFGDKYQTRRNTEADLWLKGLEREGRTAQTEQGDGEQAV